VGKNDRGKFEDLAETTRIFQENLLLWSYMKQVSFGYEELVCMLHVLTSQYLNNIVFVSEGISGSKYLKLKQFWILFWQVRYVQMEGLKGWR
jgi:hypothetical protein